MYAFRKKISTILWGKTCEKTKSKFERKKLYTRTKQVPPWLERQLKSLYELLLSSFTKKNGSFKRFFHSLIMKINFQKIWFCLFLQYQNQVKNNKLLCLKEGHKFGFGNGVESYCDWSFIHNAGTKRLIYQFLNTKMNPDAYLIPSIHNKRVPIYRTAKNEFKS